MRTLTPRSAPHNEVGIEGPEPLDTKKAKQMAASSMLTGFSSHFCSADSTRTPRFQGPSLARLPGFAKFWYRFQ
jgi:hypothetical protein